MPNWYLLRNGQTYGPYPEEQVREWVRTGKIAADEKLNREGDPNWLSLDMVPEFGKEVVAAPDHAPAPELPFPAPEPLKWISHSNEQKDKTVAGILAIVLGGLGIHHFYLGNVTIGIIYVVLGCFGVSFILGVIDGIIYLTKSDDEFQRNYHQWFCAGT